jgi:hypothetical protein
MALGCMPLPSAGRYETLLYVTFTLCLYVKRSQIVVENYYL